MDGFTIKRFGNKQGVCAGQIVGVRGDLIYVQITQGFEEILEYYNNEGQLFSLNFFTNRLVYKMLMNTLEWIKKHGLHSVLINNPYYDQIDYSIPNLKQYEFKCSISQTLNDEQQSAVQQIVWGENDKVPFILHGPPGKIKSI